MFERIRTLLHHLHDVKEVNALSDRDLADIGMSRGQLLEFLDMPHDIAQRVSAMGRIFGVPEAELKRDHASWVDLLTVCGHCHHRGACANLLARGPGADPTEATFCDNRGSFRELSSRVA